MGSPGEKLPWQATLLAATILSSCFLLSQGQDGTILVTVEPPMPRKGASVTLKPGTLPENSVNCRWYRGEVLGTSLILIHYIGVPGDTKGPAHTGRETVDTSCSLQITNLNTTDSGTYTLTTDGPGFLATGTAKFEVIEKLSKPVLSPAKYTALELENVTLYCDISSNSAFNISWFKGDLALPAKAIISGDKNLTLPDFTKDDAGTYTCTASNHLSTEDSNPSIITLAYGPLNVKVEPAGVISQKVGSKLVLLCTADSNPEAQFQWFFNGTDQRVTNNTFSIDSVAWKDEGNYTCQANNTITKSHDLASVFVKVTKGGGGPDPYLPGGAIAGIVIGCVAGVILIAGLVYFLYTKTSRGRTEHHISNGNIPSAPGHNQGVTDTKPRSGEEDVQYSTLAFNANNPPPPTPGAAPPSDGTIIYSEIKKK